MKFRDENVEVAIGFVGFCALVLCGALAAVGFVIWIVYMLVSLLV